MDFIGGGDLFSLIEKRGHLRESWVQIYSAEIASASAGRRAPNARRAHQGSESAPATRDPRVPQPAVATHGECACGRGRATREEHSTSAGRLSAPLSIATHVRWHREC